MGVLRRADVDALELVLGRDPLLDELGQLAPDFGQLLADLSAQVLVDLNNLQLCLGDLALSLGDDETSDPRSPSSRAASRSKAVTRVIWIRFFCQSSRTPFSSWPISSISRCLAATWSAMPWICSRSWAMRSFSCAL